jgi:hypothetical protein
VFRSGAKRRTGHGAMQDQRARAFVPPQLGQRDDVVLGDGPVVDLGRAASWPALLRITKKSGPCRAATNVSRVQLLGSGATYLNY